MPPAYYIYGGKDFLTQAKLHNKNQPKHLRSLGPFSQNKKKIKQQKNRNLNLLVKLLVLVTGVSAFYFKTLLVRVCIRLQGCMGLVVCIPPISTILVPDRPQKKSSTGKLSSMDPKLGVGFTLVE